MPCVQLPSDYVDILGGGDLIRFFFVSFLYGWGFPDVVESSGLARTRKRGL